MPTYAARSTVVAPRVGQALAEFSLSIGKAGIRALAHGLFESMKERGVHVATVTVAAYVNPGSKDAEAVAEQFWQLHAQAKDSGTVEATYSS